MNQRQPYRRQAAGRPGGSRLKAGDHVMRLWGGSRRALAVRDNPGGRCPRLPEMRPAAASIGCAPVDRASSPCRAQRGGGHPPRPRPTARRKHPGLAMAPRRRPGMRVAAFSETLTGTASSRANTLPPTSPAATWHGTGGAGAPRSAAWPSRSSQRGGGGCSERRTPARCAPVRDDSVHKP